MASSFLYLTWSIYLNIKHCEPTHLTMAVIVIVITTCSKFPTLMSGSELMYSYSAGGVAAAIFYHAIVGAN